MNKQAWTTRLPIPVLALAGWLAGASMVPAQGPPPADPLLEINQTLKALVALVERQAAGQHIELLMRQVELKRARLSPLEAELQQAKAAKEAAEEQLRQLEINKEEVANGFGLELDSPEQTPEQREQMEKMIDQMNRHYGRETKAAKERLALAEQKIAGLDSDVQAARAEAEHWEGVVDRELDRR